MGRALAERGIELVFGGGRVGMMGTLADAVLAYGGYVVGVIPEALQEREVGHVGVQELHVVDTMHTRKALMARLSDGFVALPGGLGTLEELFEVATWSQLGFHAKPFGLLNVAGFFSPLIEQLRLAQQEGFIHTGYEPLISATSDIDALLDRLGAPPRREPPVARVVGPTGGGDKPPA